MQSKVLCVDDDLTIQALVQASLRNSEVDFATTIQEATEKMERSHFAAVLVDIELPDGDGLRFLSSILATEKYAKTPILVLSGHTQIPNKLMAFSMGAEDFITKPFDPLELQARVDAKIKRYLANKEQLRQRRVGNLLIDFDRQKAFGLNQGREEDLLLTSIELKILSLLTKRLEQVYSREQILSDVWGQTFISDRTIDSHVGHLRKKIEPTLVKIETLKNFGYFCKLT